MRKLAIFISGGGTTMEQVLTECFRGVLQGLMEPVLVVASKPNIKGLQRALDAGMKPDQVVVCQRGGSSSIEYGNVLLHLLENSQADLVAQFGWLPLTPANVVETYKGRIFNQHPGPLDMGYPDFGGKGMYGRRVHCARLYFARKSGLPGDQFTEATAHMVTPEFDKGYVIGRTRIEILQSDDVASLQEKVLLEEHKLQIQVLERLARNEQWPIGREIRLVKPDQFGLLEESKIVAGWLFPNG